MLDFIEDTLYLLLVLWGLSCGMSFLPILVNLRFPLDSCLLYCLTVARQYSTLFYFTSWSIAILLERSFFSQVAMQSLQRTSSRFSSRVDIQQSSIQDNIVEVTCLASGGGVLEGLSCSMSFIPILVNLRFPLDSCLLYCHTIA